MTKKQTDTLKITDFVSKELTDKKGSYKTYYFNDTAFTGVIYDSTGYQTEMIFYFKNGIITQELQFFNKQLHFKIVYLDKYERNIDTWRIDPKVTTYTKVRKGMSLEYIDTYHTGTTLSTFFYKKPKSASSGQKLNVKKKILVFETDQYYEIKEAGKMHICKTVEKFKNNSTNDSKSKPVKVGDELKDGTRYSINGKTKCKLKK